MEKQELPVLAMFANRSGRNEQSLYSKDNLRTETIYKPAKSSQKKGEWTG